MRKTACSVRLPTTRAALRALASRSLEAEPLRVADAELLLLRDAFASVEAPLREELAPAVGRVIVVDTQQWQAKKRVTAVG